MNFKITPEAAIRSVEIWMKFIVSWPPPLNSTKKRLILHDVAWCVSFCIPLVCIAASVLHSWMGPNDVVELTKDITECLSVVTAAVKMIISRWQQSRFQVAHAEMEIFLKTAGPRERAMMDRYLAKYGTFYAAVQVLCILSGLAYTCGPIILPQPLPARFEYPFPWRDSPKIIAILYFTQLIVIAQVAAGAVVDMHVALLLFFSGIRFELLAEDFENVRSSADLRECIAKHQKLIKSVEEIIIAVRLFAVDVIVNTGITNICIGYQFISHQPIEVILHIISLFIVSCVEVAMYSWPADNLFTVSGDIARAAYAIPWVGQSQEMTNAIQMVIMRSQKPLVIAIDGVLPQVNLDFYGKYLSTSYSYFTTLRTLVG